MALVNFIPASELTQRSHQEKVRARSTTSYQRSWRQHFCARLRDGTRLLWRTGGYGDHAVRERGKAARQVSAEASDDRADQPSAPARDAVLGVRRGRHHAE